VEYENGLGKMLIFGVFPS